MAGRAIPRAGHFVACGERRCPGRGGSIRAGLSKRRGRGFSARESSGVMGGWWPKLLAAMRIRPGQMDWRRLGMRLQRVSR